MEKYILLSIGMCLILFTITAAKFGWVETPKVKNKSALNISMMVIAMSAILLLLNT
ncbi:hypothetical protein [Neisseria sp.]|uniref:hypothetical protein n=1 Tax=Neisseria sp. TaxID=192066 RepID=UPI0035A1AC01